MIGAAKILAQSLIKNDTIKQLPQTQLTQGANGTVPKVLSIVFGIAGAISVLVIMIGAFQYITSSGDPQSIKRAKDTILYAVIGLVVCATAFTIVTFVVDKL